MGFWNRLAGYPNGDPTGRSRALFCKVGWEASRSFMLEENHVKAADIVEGFTNAVTLQCGEFHPDIGRASLLMAVLFTTIGRFETALGLAEVAGKLLEKLGPADGDHLAALYLVSQLQKNPTNSSSNVPNEIVRQGNPAGDFLFGLRP